MARAGSELQRGTGMNVRGLGVVLSTLSVGVVVAACSSGDGVMAPSADEKTNAPDASAQNAPDAGGIVMEASSPPPMDAAQTSPSDATTGGGVPDAGVTVHDAGAGGREAGGPGDDAGTAPQDAGADEGVDAGPYGWGDRTDIQEIFARYCNGCHGTSWQSCWSDQENASTLTSVISSGAMPRGSTMSSMDKSAVLAWLSSGAPCAGPRQDAGAVILPGGGAAPVAGPTAAAP
jgi:hypothetical protein